MAVVLVTGGTGTLGQALVPVLQAAGHDVRVLSRRDHGRLPAGVRRFRGDVRTGVGVADAAAGADVVVHAASSPGRRMRATEIAGARLVSAAAVRNDAHLIYTSIVGVDRHRFPYYRAKRAAEIVVEDSGAGWTVLRATQFHDLLHRVLGNRWFIRTPGLRFQPVDVGEVARRVADLVAGPPGGLAPDFGGPEILSIAELAETRRAATGERTRLVPAPAIGFLADFDAGLHLAPDHRAGRRTWPEWLNAKR